MDKRSLIEDSDAETIAEYLQMDTVKRSNRIYIRCPGHEKRIGRPDMNIGNAVLKRGGYTCYSCGVFVNNHDMVMEVTGCSSEEAYQIMAEATGNPEKYQAETNQETSMPKYRLSAEEAEIIGLQRNVVTVLKKQTQNGIGVVYDGLNILYKKNPDIYYQMIVDRSCEMRDKYRLIKDKYAATDAEQAHVIFEILGDSFDNSIYRKISREVDMRIEVCNRIIQIFSKEIHKPVA